MTNLTKYEGTKNLYMTVKEVAKVLGVGEATIKRTVEKLRSELTGVKNSQGGYEFNEQDVTKIKLLIEKNPHIDTQGLPKTDLEKQLIIRQARQYMEEALEEARRELNDAQPKIEFYDSVAGSSDAISIREVAKVLNMDIGQNRLFSLLRKYHILMDSYPKNTPYQKYIDAGWFRVIEQKYELHGEVQISFKTLVYQKGIEGIRRLVKKYYLGEEL